MTHEQLQSLFLKVTSLYLACISLISLEVQESKNRHMELSNSNFKIENTTITNVHILFGVLVSSTGSINRLSVENMITRAVLLIRDSSPITIQNSHFNTISQGLSSILAYSSYFDEIRNIKFSNIGSANCIYMKN